MDYKKLAADIIELVGGEKNVQSVTHCATRLRFNLKDDSAAQTDKLKKVKGVMGVVNKGGQYQVIIGSDVGSVYRQILDLGSFDGGKDNGKDNGDDADDKGPVIKVLDTIAGIFTPIIPAITGAGMLKAVMALLVAFKVIDTASETYQFLNFFADAAFYFLPFLIANSAAKKFKCNAYMAMSIAGVLLHPNFISMVNTAKEEGVGLEFIGLPVSLASYSSSVIPIILGIWFMSFVEPLAEKVSPKPVRFFTKPLLTLIVTAPVTLIVLGPLGNIIGDGIAAGISFLNKNVSWLVPLIVGTFTPLMVMTGMHYGLIPIGINNIATAGFDTVVGPGMLGSNIAQGGASLAVAVRTKNSEVRQLATSAGITAVCGITEPAMYGVSLRFKRPLIAAMVGGGVAGLFLGITGVGRYTSGSPGLLALPGYIGTEGPRNIIFACIGAAIAFVVSFIISFILGIQDPEEDEQGNSGGSSSGGDGQTNGQNAGYENDHGAGGQKNRNGNDFAAGRSGTEGQADGQSGVRPASNITESIVYAPISGKAVPLNTVNDPTFAEEILGRGIAIVPQEGKVYAPFDGKVNSIFDTKHALGLVNTDGIELLIHVGLDTVNLEGRHFNAKVSNDEEIKKGQLLLEFDMNAIKEEGYDIITPIVVTNSDDYECIDELTMGQVENGTELLKVTGGQS